MVKVLEFTDLPGGPRVWKFEGGDHGAGASFFVGGFAPGTGPDLHHHPYEETFVIEEGTATFTIDGEVVEAHGGQIVIVPAGAVHGFKNSGDVVLRQVSVHPMPRMEQTFVDETPS